MGYLIAYTINVLLMLAILRAIAWDPMADMLEQRRERIAEGLNNARRAEEALASAEADKQALLEDARAEAQKIVSEARSRAEETKKSTVQAAEEEASRTKEQAVVEAQQLRENALSDMREQIIDLAIAAAGHLVGGLDENKQRQMAESFFTEIPAEAKDFSGNVVVITAVPLTDSEKADAENMFANADSVTFRVDPSILGGVIVRAGARELDHSYSAQMSAMRANLN
jgi:F-type H+-transporting ATPase subunit b